MFHHHCLILALAGLRTAIKISSGLDSLQKLSMLCVTRGVSRPSAQFGNIGILLMAPMNIFAVRTTESKPLRSSTF